METGATALPRVRRLSVGANAFRRLALVNAGMLLIVVATGATVRLTASGLGCEHWPGCQAGRPLPAQGFHSYVEFGNRVVAFFTILATLLTWLAARQVELPRAVRWLALGTFLGTLGQAPLGAVTVYYHLNPYLVLSHFLLSLVVLTLGVAVASEAVGHVRGRGAQRTPDWARRVGLVIVLACGVLVVTGTLATAGGPHPGSNKTVDRIGNFEHSVWLHVRATAVFGIAFATLLVWLVRARSPHVRPALVVLGVLAVQMLVGEVQYRNRLPWWLVLGHVTLAASVWAVTVAFVYGLWRPTASRIRA